MVYREWAFLDKSLLVITDSSRRSRMSASASTTPLAPTVSAVLLFTTTGPGDLQRARMPMSAKVGAWDRSLRIAAGMGTALPVSHMEHGASGFVAYNCSPAFRSLVCSRSGNPLTASTFLSALKEPGFGPC